MFDILQFRLLRELNGWTKGCQKQPFESKNHLLLTALFIFPILSKVPDLSTSYLETFIYTWRV